MPSISQQQVQPKNDPPPPPVPPRARLEELLGRDFTEFLLEALTESPRPYGRRGSSSP